MPKIDLSQWKQLAPLPLPRAGSAVGILDGKLVVAGGTYWREGRKFWCEQVDGFDPSTNRWAPKAPLPGGAPVEGAVPGAAPAPPKKSAAPLKPRAAMKLSDEQKGGKSALNSFAQLAAFMKKEEPKAAEEAKPAE